MTDATLQNIGMMHSPDGVRWKATSVRNYNLLVKANMWSSRLFDAEKLKLLRDVQV